MSKIINVKILGHKRIYLKFSNGFEGEILFLEYFSKDKNLSPAFLDEHFFKSVSLCDDEGTITWPNGYTPSSDLLYAIITNQFLLEE